MAIRSINSSFTRKDKYSYGFNEENELVYYYPNPQSYLEVLINGVEANMDEYTSDETSIDKNREFIKTKDTPIIHQYNITYTYLPNIKKKNDKFNIKYLRNHKSKTKFKNKKLLSQIINRERVMKKVDPISISEISEINDICYEKNIGLINESYVIKILYELLYDNYGDKNNIELELKDNIILLKIKKDMYNIHLAAKNTNANIFNSIDPLANHKIVDCGILYNHLLDCLTCLATFNCVSLPAYGYNFRNYGIKKLMLSINRLIVRICGDGYSAFGEPYSGESYYIL